MLQPATLDADIGMNVMQFPRFPHLDHLFAMFKGYAWIFGGLGEQLIVIESLEISIHSGLSYARRMGEKAKSIEEYLNALDPEYRAELERIRSLVQHLVPGAEEAMSYGMPTLKYKNRALVYFTASKKHMSFYPSSWAIEELRDQLQQYKTTEHAIQFTLDKTLSSQLIEDLVRVHVRDIDANRQ